MKLSDVICNINESYVLSDGEFTSMGLAVSKCDEKLLSFIVSDKYINDIQDNIDCLITTKEIGEKLKDKYGIIISNNPRVDYFKLHNRLANDINYTRTKYETSIGANCIISNTASISTNNVTIGNNVVIEDFVIIRENTIIGDNSIIRSGCILGGEGYEFKRVDKRIMNVIHLGGVVIGENVEVQYNSCIDKKYCFYTNIRNIIEIKSYKQ